MNEPAIGARRCDVDDWLDGLGLAQYRQLFAEQAIDSEVLPDLTEQDLIALGIPLGHRKKMVRAIAALGRTVDLPPAPQPAANREDRTERRQVTILFCDLVNSTVLAGRLDPEDLRTIVNTCLDACSVAVTRFNGQVARLLGDGLMAYFGYPFAREDAAECATRAALDAIQSVRALDLLPNVTLQMRAGIATGLVVIGDLIGEGAAREEAVVGTTPAMAARLQALAPPGSVLVDPMTRRLFGETFDLESLGPQQFKGIASDTPVWRVVGERHVETRFEAAHSASLPDFVGRDDEIALLLSRWHAAENGEGQVILLSGEAGIGKSRTCMRLRERIMDRPHTLVRLQCSPFHTNSALYPAIANLEHAAGVRSEQPIEEKRERLAKLLAATQGGTREGARLLETLLSIAPDAGGSTPEFSAKELKQRTLETLADRLIALARRNPVLWLIEDVHWIDPTTLELVTLCIDRLEASAILALVTFRPEFQQSWISRGHVTALNLSRLGRQHTAELVGRVTGGKTLPAEVLDTILAKTDGVPLFVEELTRTVLESGVLEERSTEYVLGQALVPMAIPATLQGSLLARLDRLAPVKEAAQIAAVIGREFTYELVAAVEPFRAAGLQEALRQLAEAGLIHARGTPPAATYVFKHALVRDAVYDTLLHSRRHVLHARVAEVLCDRFAEIAASQPELVAHHFTAAGLSEAAIGWWRRAGERAVLRSANTEAVAHLSQARRLLATLPEAVRAQHELDVEALLGQATTEIRGYAAPETLAVWQRARALLRTHSDSLRKFAVLYGLWAAAYVRGEAALQQRVASEALAEAERLGDSVGLCVANRNLGTTLVVSGHLESGRQHLQRALTLYDPERHRPLMYRFGQDIGATAMSHLSLALYHLGLIDQALAMAEAAVRHATALNHPHTLAYTLAHTRVFLDACRASTGNEAAYADLLTLCRRYDFRFWGAIAQMYHCWAAIARGDIAGQIAAYEQALEAVGSVGARNWMPVYQALHAQGLAKAGDAQRALHVIDEAISTARTYQEVFALAEVLRVKSGILLLLGRGADAQGCLVELLVVAREQGALCFALRSAIDLARLAIGPAERAAAVATLRGAYDRFTEGFASHELTAARSALAEFGARADPARDLVPPPAGS